MGQWLLDKEIKFISPKAGLEREIYTCQKRWRITYDDFFDLFSRNNAIVNIALLDKYRNRAPQVNFRIEVLHYTFWEKSIVSEWSVLLKEFNNNMSDVDFRFKSSKSNTDFKIRFYIQNDKQPVITNEANPKAPATIEIKNKQKPEAIKGENQNEIVTYKSNFLTDFCNKLNKSQQAGYFTDLTICCDTELFYVHKVILSARSPVFETMLQNPMKESKTQEVKINDIKPEVFRSIIEHIYTNKGIQESDSIDMVLNMLAAADKYMLYDLKQSCVDRIKSIVSVDNSLNILSIADIYDINLKEYIIRFICNEYDALKDTSEWKALRTQNPSLIIDVISSKVEFMKEKWY